MFKNRLKDAFQSWTRVITKIMLLAKGRPTTRSIVGSCWRTVYLVRLFARGKLFSGFFVSNVKLGGVNLSLSQTKLCVGLRSPKL